MASRRERESGVAEACPSATLPLNEIAVPCSITGAGPLGGACGGGASCARAMEAAASNNVADVLSLK